MSKKFRELIDAHERALTKAVLAKMEADTLIAERDRQVNTIVAEKSQGLVDGVSADLQGKLDEARNTLRNREAAITELQDEIRKVHDANFELKAKLEAQTATSETQPL